MGQMYLITFKTSDKSYVGISSKSATHRWKYHIRSNNDSLIARAIRTYGVENCILSIIGESGSWLELCAMEMAAIKEHNTKWPNGFNGTLGGQGAFGLIHTAETRGKMSTSKKATHQTPEARAAQSKRTKERMSDPVARANLSKKTKQQWASPELVAKMIAQSKLARNTLEYRATCSAHAKTIFCTPEFRAAQSARLKARYMSPDTLTRQRSHLALVHAKNAGRAFSYI